jgi:IS30 family transposase
MAVRKVRPQPGPGAEREQYRRLMAQGLNNRQACLQIGVQPTTGMRWRKGRNMVDHTGKARHYPPINAEPPAISPRYLSEEERILIGDLLAAGRTQRSVAAQVGRSPSTISREIRRNTSGAGNYRPFGAHRKALARAGLRQDSGRNSPRSAAKDLLSIEVLRRRK